MTHSTISIRRRIAGPLATVTVATSLAAAVAFPTPALAAPGDPQTELPDASGLVFDISPRSKWINAGESVTYTITLQNTTGVDLTQWGDGWSSAGPGAIEMAVLPNLGSISGLVASHDTVCSVLTNSLDCSTPELPAGETLTITYTTTLADVGQWCAVSPGYAYALGGLPIVYAPVTGDGGVNEGTVSLGVICDPLDATAQLESAEQVGEVMTLALAGQAINAVPDATTTWTVPDGAVLASAYVNPAIACSALAGGQTATFAVSDGAGQSVSREVALPECEPRQDTAIEPPPAAAAPTPPPAAPTTPAALPNTAISDGVAPSGSTAWITVLLGVLIVFASGTYWLVRVDLPANRRRGGRR